MRQQQKATREGGRERTRRVCDETVSRKGASRSARKSSLCGALSLRGQAGVVNELLRERGEIVRVNVPRHGRERVEEGDGGHVACRKSAVPRGKTDGRGVWEEENARKGDESERERETKHAVEIVDAAVDAGAQVGTSQRRGNRDVVLSCGGSTGKGSRCGSAPRRCGKRWQGPPRR